MRLYQFKEELLQGKHCEKELNVILEMFEDSFNSMGKLKQYANGESFVIHPRGFGEDYVRDYSELEEVFEYITENHLKIETSVLQEPEEFVKQIDLKNIDDSVKNFIKMVYAIFLYKKSYLKYIKHVTPSYIIDLTKIDRMLWYEYRFNDLTGRIESKEFRVPFSAVDKCMKLISYLNNLYGYEVYLKDNGTLIVPDAVGSGTTIIFYARTDAIEVYQGVLYPKGTNSFAQLHKNLYKEINYIREKYLDQYNWWRANLPQILRANAGGNK